MRGYLEFSQDPADTDALVADYFIYPDPIVQTSRRQIRETDDEDEEEASASEAVSDQSAVMVGRVRVQLRSPAMGELTYATVDEPVRHPHINDRSFTGLLFPKRNKQSG